MSTENTARGFRKTREGIVTSDKMDKTVVVEIKDQVKHGLYSKVMTRTHKLKAHDENNTRSRPTEAPRSRSSPHPYPARSSPSTTTGRASPQYPPCPDR